MADKTVESFEVPSKVISSYKELTKSVKDAQSAQVSAAQKFGEGSTQFKEATKRVSELKDKVDDLKDASNSLKGSGIERSANGFNLLGEGMRNLDFDKVKIGLGAIKSALAATGIMLIVQGVTYLIENFDKLSEGSGILAKSLRFVGDVLGEIKDAAYAVTDALGLTNSELDKQGEAIKTYSEGVSEGLSNQTKEWDRQIKAAEAAGKSTVELEKAKQQAIIDTNVLIVKQIEAFVRAGGALDDEKKKQLTASLNLIKDAVVEQDVIELKDNKEKAERHKEHLEQKHKEEEDHAKRKADMQKAINDSLNSDEEEKYNALMDKKAEADHANSEKILADRSRAYQDDVKAAQAAVNKTTADWQAGEKAKQEATKNRLNASLSIAQSGANALMALNDLVTQTENQNRKKGDKISVETMKKQFNRNKAMAITTTAINTAAAIIAQIGNPTPYVGFVLGALAGVTGALQIAAIASKKFDGGDSESGDGSVTGPATTGTQAGAPPTINTPQNSQPTTTSFDNNGNNQNIGVTVKAEVVETEMTQKQKGVQKVQQQSSF